MVKKLMVLSIVCVLALPVGVLAQNPEWKANAGDYEFTLSGSGTNDEDFDNTTLSVEGSIGYFLSNYLEVALRQGFGYADIPGSDDKYIASTRVALDFHFGSGRWQPFLGASIGYLYGDIADDQFIAGPEAGLKIFVNNTTFLYGAAEYQFLFENADEADEAFDDGRFVYTLGLGFRW